MGLRGGGIAGFVTAKCIMESNPVIRGINNGHHLGEVQIFYQDFDVQFSAGVDVHTDDEYVRVNDHCTDAIRMVQVPWLADSHTLNYCPNKYSLRPDI